MRKKDIKLPLTPITESTFLRQGWKRNKVGDSIGGFGQDDMFLDGSMFRNNEEDETEEFEKIEDDNTPFFYSLPLPKDDDERFSVMLVSNASDETGLLKDMGLKPDTFFVEILDMNGLGFCSSEEELEVLYRALTKKEIE
jgi:hypothetical protein